MSRDLLSDANEAVAAARERLSDEELRDRLETLSSRLQSQAERDTTPALGTLDRIQNGLEEVASSADDATVTEQLEDARENIFSFLETLEDRGMKQHGWSVGSESNGAA